MMHCVNTLRQTVTFTIVVFLFSVFQGPNNLMHSFSLSDSTVVEYHYVVTTLHICMCVPFEYM